jgi:L-2-hydroxyglutarate oxidase LhgO
MENHTTIDQLAGMINTGVNDVKKDVGQLKTDVNQLQQEMQAGFERIEHLLLAEQKREIEDLKQRMKRLEDALAV